MRPGDRLCVTVDVECDSDGGSTWKYSDPIAFRGVSHGIGEVLAPMLRELGATATFLVSNVVLDHPASVEVLAAAGDHVELGTHLHGDFLPPNQRVAAPDGAKTVENQCDYDDATEEAKLALITERFEAAFDRRPTAFRAGRWSAGGRTASLLARLGYRVDSSVTPGVHWQDGGRSVDFTGAPDQPYRPSGGDIAVAGDLPIWELPVSIVRHRALGSRPLWLRPTRLPEPVMRHVVRSLRRRTDAPRTFVLMLHNTELTVGTSPYSRDQRGADAVASRLRRFLEWSAGAGISTMTLTEAAAALDAERGLDA